MESKEKLEREKEEFKREKEKEWEKEKKGAMDKDGERNEGY